MVARGDGENYAMVGDIVRLRYTCFLEGDLVLAAKMKKNWKTKDERPPDGAMVSSTKAGMGRSVSSYQPVRQAGKSVSNECCVSI